MDGYVEILRKLIDGQVRFVVIGGYAAVLHGADYLTKDVDVCAPMDVENLRRIIAALRDINPTFRSHIKPIPLHKSAEALVGVRNLYLKTDLGFLDILNEVSGVGSFDDVHKQSSIQSFHGRELHIIEIDALIAAKQAAGREKDKAGVMQLEAVKRARADRPPGDAT